MVIAPSLIALPLAAAFLTPLLGIVSKRVVRWVPVLACACNLLVAGWLLPQTLALGSPVALPIGGWEPPFGISLQVGALGVGLALLIALVGLLTAVYAVTAIRVEAEARYHMLFLLLITGATGMVMTGDIFNLFVFLEIMCISAYALTATMGDAHGTEAAFKYLVQGSLGSVLVLLAIALIYGVFGTLNMADIAQHVQTGGSARGGVLVLITLLFVIGIGVESAIFPLNAWLPDAHSSAPSPISAVLSGFVIEVALAAMIKVLYSVLGTTVLLPVLGTVGVVTLLVGEFVAYRQQNIKRVLAYSSIGQIGLILFAFSLASRDAAAAGLLQIASHALAKSAMFLAAGYMIVRTGSYDYRSYAGLAKKMPIACAVFALGALSLIGVPPLFGFFSKLAVILAAGKAGGLSLLAALLWVLLGTVVEAAYFLRIVQVLYFGEKETATGVDEPAGDPDLPGAPAISVSVFALLILVGFLLIPNIRRTAVTAATELTTPLHTIVVNTK